MDKMQRKAFAKNIKEYRKNEGISQKHFAETLNVNPSTVASWERCATIPKEEILSILCVILNMSVDDIFYAEEEVPVVVQIKPPKNNIYNYIRKV